LHLPCTNETTKSVRHCQFTQTNWSWIYGLFLLVRNKLYGEGSFSHATDRTRHLNSLDTYPKIVRMSINISLSLEAKLNHTRSFLLLGFWTKSVFCLDFPSHLNKYSILKSEQLNTFPENYWTLITLTKNT